MGPIQKINHAVNDWKALLVSFGVPVELLTVKGTPCPICGGDDRFTWDGKHNGSGYCRNCGHLSGITLIQDVNGWSLKVAIKELLGHLGINEIEPSFQRKKRLMEEEINQYKKSLMMFELSKSPTLKIVDWGEVRRHKETVRQFREKYPNYLSMVGI